MLPLSREARTVGEASAAAEALVLQLRALSREGRDSDAECRVRLTCASLLAVAEADLFLPLVTRGAVEADATLPGARGGATMLRSFFEDSGSHSSYLRARPSKCTNTCGTMSPPASPPRVSMTFAGRHSP